MTNSQSIRSEAQVPPLSPPDDQSCIRCGAPPDQPCRECELQEAAENIVNWPLGNRFVPKPPRQAVGPKPPELTEVQVSRIESMLGQIALSAVRKAKSIDKRFNWSDWTRARLNRVLEHAFLTIVNRRANQIIKAADVRNSLIEEVDSLRKERSGLKAAQRKELRAAEIEFENDVAELRETRDRLAAQCRTLQRQNQLLLSSDTRYPPVPDEMVKASIDGNGLPNTSGIYFVWKNGVVRYVGQAINLANRCHLAHHAINEGEGLSYIEFDKHLLTWAENYYIGTLQAWRNYGRGATHQKYEPGES